MTYSIAWAAGTMSAQLGAWGVTYGDKFVAIGNGGTTGDAWTSTDGVTWTQQASMPRNGSNGWVGPAWNGSRYVCVAQNNAPTVAYSSDGMTWTTAANMPTTDTWIGVVYGAGVFSCVVDNAATTPSLAAAYSTDGITWHSTAMPSAQNWGVPVFGASVFIAPIATSVTSSYAYSTDGITWAAGTIPVADTWVFVASPTRILAVGTTNSNCYYSTNGTTWAVATYPGLSVVAGCFGNGVFLLVDNTNYVVSSDGVSWTPTAATASTTNSGWVLCAGPGNEFVLVNRNTNVGSASQYGYLAASQIVMWI